MKLTSLNGEETRKCLSGSVSRFDSLKVVLRRWESIAGNLVVTTELKT